LASQAGSRTTDGRTSTTKRSCISEQQTV
jgi:hypothetical protein